jgi:hypothetical protein
MMRRESSYRLVALVVLAWGAAAGQSFTFVPDDTVLSAPLGVELVFNVTITNTSTQVLTLALVRTLNDLPQGWESSMCLSVCFPPTTDSILTTPEFGSSPLNPNESRPFSLHVYSATNHGTGTVRIVARNNRDTSDQRVLTLHALSIPVNVTESSETPGRFALYQNYPNPFNPATTIQYQIRQAGHVVLKVCDVSGREVTTLVDEVQRVGSYQVLFDATHLASGVYFYKLDAGSFTSFRRSLLLK